MNIIRSYGFLWKKDGEGHMLLFKEENDRPNVFFREDKALKLYFYVLCQDNSMWHYSNLMKEDMKEGYILSNTFEDEFSLYTGTYLSNHEKVMFISHLRELDNQVNDDEDVEVAFMPIYHEKGKVIYKGKYDDLKYNGLFEGYDAFSFFEITSLRKKILCCKNLCEVRNLFGVAEIVLDPQKLAQGPVHFKVNIDSRPVIWRYYLVNNERASYKDFKIYSGKAQVSLNQEGQEGKKLANGDFAYILETAGPLNLADKYDQLFELELTKVDSKNGEALSRKRFPLPVPDMDKVKIFKEENGYKAYSYMYIYL